MAAKIKSILVLIGVFLIYWFGMSFTTGFLYNVFSSFVLSVFAAQLIFSFPFLYVMFRKSKIALIGEETVKEKICPWWVLLGLGLAIALMARIYYHLFSPYSAGSENITYHGLEGICMFMSNVLMYPIIEELFFRKWMVTYLERKDIKPIYILLITSVLFFIVHTNTQYMYFRFDTLLSGAILYYIYTRYRNIKYCISLHMIWNLVVNLISIANQHMLL